ncbi:hypothetical protein JVX98_31745 (plasmid) [Ensifer sp. PDNC004]|uniref:hypothetical protein n=1 Tax=Ensifer sp. PDNC004 TaxID=2811423 RepID=UPI0019636956|nr:hypothetical protein [Ensifer sp. PDNC004]QRY70607.1 hypothetical protein JVX98_31745 [Ensifer sp. PDNC004]
MPAFTSEELRRALAALQDLVDYDEEFRHAARQDARVAVEQALGLTLPADMEVRQEEADGRMRLAAEWRTAGELSDDELEVVTAGLLDPSTSAREKTVVQRI